MIANSNMFAVAETASFTHISPEAFYFTITKEYFSVRYCCARYEMSLLEINKPALMSSLVMQISHKVALEKQYII